ncbi:hypothetical protein EV401DRAFT_1956486, partial [Pisolithus croceorrhizus]
LTVSHPRRISCTAQRSSLCETGRNYGGFLPGLYVSTASYYYALFDNRFTMSDVAIVSSCARFNTPAFIVWSKADQHTRDVMNGMGHDRNDDESNLGPHGRLRGETFKPRKRDGYISFSTTLLSIVKEKAPRKAVDEIEIQELPKDIINQTLTRHKTSEGSMSF